MKEYQLQKFKSFMESQRYTKRTIRLYMACLEWLPDFPPTKEKAALLEHITRSLSEVRPFCHRCEFTNVRAASHIVFKMVSGVDIDEYTKSLRQPGRFAPQLDAFYEYSVHVKNILPATARAECTHVDQFLAYIVSGTDTVIFEHITAVEIRDYVCAKISTLADSSKGRYVTSLRNFFRFLAYTWIPVHPSVCTLPLSPVAWNNRRFPTTLTEDEVQRLLAYFCGSSEKQTRNHAIILVFLDLGLRCAEVSSLTLHDICWHRGEIVIRKTKTRRERVLPLSIRLGKALETYILQYRGNAPDEHLFLRTGRYEGQPMNTEQVRSIVRSAFQKLHIEGWWKGTHALRRTAASKVFNSGTSLKLTADILGHCAIQSTTAYVKIDTDSLAFLAGDWPQGGASC